MRTAPLLPLLLVVGLAACARSAEPTPTAVAPAEPPASPKQANASPLQQLDKKQFGAPITEKTTTPLATILKEPSKFGGQTVRTEGVVSAVCKSMGCWMEIADDSGNAHVKMAGHSFFVPREAAGHRAVIQGKLVGAEEGAACGQKDGCREESEKETGRVAKVEMEATGVEFLD